MNFDQKHVVMHALLIAAERFDDHAKDFGALARDIRAWAIVAPGAANPPALALFAPGEAGARGAERMAEQFQHQAQECRTVRDELEREDMGDDDE